METHARPSADAPLITERPRTEGADDDPGLAPGWSAVRERLADRWPDLTTDELDATHGRVDLLAALLQAKLAYAQLLAEESVGQPMPLEAPMTHGPGRSWLSVLGLSSLSVFGLTLRL
jgi:hypothetical protein